MELLVQCLEQAFETGTLKRYVSPLYFTMETSPTVCGNDKPTSMSSSAVNTTNRALKAPLVTGRNGKSVTEEEKRQSSSHPKTRTLATLAVRLENPVSLPSSLISEELETGIGPLTELLDEHSRELIDKMEYSRHRREAVRIQEEGAQESTVERVSTWLLESRWDLSPIAMTLPSTERWQPAAPMPSIDETVSGYCYLALFPKQEHAWLAREDKIGRSPTGATVAQYFFELGVVPDKKIMLFEATGGLKRLHIVLLDTHSTMGINAQDINWARYADWVIGGGVKLSKSDKKRLAKEKKGAARLKEKGRKLEGNVYPGTPGFCYLALEAGRNWKDCADEMGSKPLLPDLINHLDGVNYIHNRSLFLSWENTMYGPLFHLSREDEGENCVTTTLRTAMLDIVLICEQKGFDQNECRVGGYTRVPASEPEADKNDVRQRRVSFEDARTNLPSAAKFHRRSVSVGRANAVRGRPDISPLSSIRSALEVEEPITTFGEDVNKAFETFHTVDLQGRKRSVSRTRKEVDGKSTEVTVIIEKNTRPALTVQTSSVSSQTQLRAFKLDPVTPTPALSEFSDFITSNKATDRSAWTSTDVNESSALTDKTVNEMLNDPAETFEHMALKMETHQGWSQKQIREGLLRTGMAAKSPVVPMDPARVVKRGGVSTKTTCFYESLRYTLTPNYWNALDAKITSPGELPWTMYRYAAWVCNDRRQDQRCFLVEIGKVIGLDDKGDTIRQDHIEYMGPRKMVMSTRGLPLGMSFSEDMHSRMTSDGSSIKMVIYGHELFPMNPRNCTFRNGISFLSQAPPLGDTGVITFDKGPPVFERVNHFWPHVEIVTVPGQPITAGGVLYLLQLHGFSVEQTQEFVKSCQPSRSLIFRSLDDHQLVISVLSGVTVPYPASQSIERVMFKYAQTSIQNAELRGRLSEAEEQVERQAALLNDATLLNETLQDQLDGITADMTNQEVQHKERVMYMEDIVARSENSLTNKTAQFDMLLRDFEEYRTSKIQQDSLHNCALTCGHTHEDFQDPHLCSNVCKHDGFERPHTLRQCGARVAQSPPDVIFPLTGLDRSMYHDGAPFECPQTHTQIDCNAACDRQHGQASVVEIVKERSHADRVKEKDVDSHGCASAEYTMKSRINYEAARARFAEGKMLQLAKERAAMVRPTFSRGNFLERPFSGGKLKLAAKTFHLPKRVIPLVDVRGTVRNGQERVFDGLWSDWVCTPAGLALFYKYQNLNDKKAFAHALGMPQHTLEEMLPTDAAGAIHVTHRDFYDEIVSKNGTKLHIGDKCR